LANNYVQAPPNSTGVKLQTFENTVGGNVVDAEAVTLVNSSGVEITDGQGGIPATLSAGPSSGSNVVGTVIAQGAKQTNVSAPGATNLGVLPAVAQAAGPIQTDGNQVALSTDLEGNLRTINAGYPQIVQNSSFSTTGTPGSLACAFPSNVRVGTMLIIMYAVGGTSAPTCADNASPANLYVSAGTSTATASTISGCFYAISRTAGACTITLTLASQSIAATIYEVSGLANGALPDFYAGTANASSANPTFTAETTTAPNDLVLVSCGVGTAAQTITFPTGASTCVGLFHNDSGQITPATPTHLFSWTCGSAIVPVPMTIPNTTMFTLAGAEISSMLIVGFKAYMDSSGGAVQVANVPAVTVNSGTVTTVSTVTTLSTVTNPVPLGPTTLATAAPSVAFINDSGAGVNLKSSAGNLYGFSITNETASVAYIEFFNTGSAPTLGTTAVLFAIKLPASANITMISDNALANFSTGIGFGVVTAENGATAAAVTGIVLYK
jgi:hypothetical protein